MPLTRRAAVDDRVAEPRPTLMLHPQAPKPYILTKPTRFLVMGTLQLEGALRDRTRVLVPASRRAAADDAIVAAPGPNPKPKPLLRSLTPRLRCLCRPLTQGRCRRSRR